MLFIVFFLINVSIEAYKLYKKHSEIVEPETEKRDAEIEEEGDDSDALSMLLIVVVGPVRRVLSTTRYDNMCVSFAVDGILGAQLHAVRAHAFVLCATTITQK